MMAKDLWLEKIEERLVNEGIKIFLERIKFSNDFNSLSSALLPLSLISFISFSSWSNYRLDFKSIDI